MPRARFDRALDVAGMSPRHALHRHFELPPARAEQAVKQPDRLWAGLYLTDLLLEAQADYDPAAPQAVTELERGQLRIRAVSAPAREQGVRPGQPVTAALALVGTLRVLPRDEAREQALLEQLAGAFAALTPVISIETPDVLLLEIGASIRLFGGLSRVQEHIRAILKDRKHHACLAIAPTPAAAGMLARSGNGLVITKTGELSRSLGDLPVRCFVTDKRRQQRLDRLGVRTLRELWRLPRAGLARRLGPDLPRALDRLLGQAADPRRTYAQPAVFHAEIEADYPLRHAADVLCAARTLLQELAQFLSMRDLGLTRLILELHHEQAPVTCISIGTRDASRDPDHWARLLGETLATLHLPAPVQRLHLRSRAIQPYVPPAMSCLKDPGPASDLNCVLDEIQARLRQPLRRVHPVADHRPDRGWRFDVPDQRSMPARKSRPIWLLPAPHPLPCRLPLWWDGALLLQSGPERIEAGWWDNEDYCRDYYLALNERGARLWIFRDLKSETWFLHGLFG